MSTPAREVIATKERLGILLTYRPIYTRSKTVAAYQVLLNSESDDCTVALPDLSSNVVLDAYSDVYQNGRVESVPSMLRVTPSMLLASEELLLPASQYILEIIIADEVPAGLVKRLRGLEQKGYRLGLAGYRPDREHLTSLLDMVHFVRLDLAKLGVEGVAEAARQLYFHSAKLLVDGVDDMGQFFACVDVGTTYFQGEFLSRSNPIKGKKISTNKMLLAQLVIELENPETTPEVLERIAIQDANLTYRILKLINSAAVGLNRKVSSLAQAIAILGTNELGRWANLLLVNGEPGKPEELMRSMLVRGRMCEILAGLSGQAPPMSAFIVGLLSRMDALTDIAMRELMKQVPLSQDVKEALLDREGPLGQVLTQVEQYESGHFDKLEGLLDPSLYEVAYRHSVKWARQSQQALDAV